MASWPILRLLRAGLGVGTVVFGIVPLLAPRWFARMFGLPETEDPAANVVVRSVAVRDLVNGIGLLLTLDNPRANRRWLAVRCLSDTGDSVACMLAFRLGTRSSRLKALGSLASGAALFGAALLLAGAYEEEPPSPGAGRRLFRRRGLAER